MRSTKGKLIAEINGIFELYEKEKDSVSYAIYVKEYSESGRLKRRLVKEDIKDPEIAMQYCRNLIEVLVK